MSERARKERSECHHHHQRTKLGQARERKEEALAASWYLASIFNSLTHHFFIRQISENIIFSRLFCNVRFGQMQCRRFYIHTNSTDAKFFIRKWRLFANLFTSKKWIFIQRIHQINNKVLYGRITYLTTHRDIWFPLSMVACFYFPFLSEIEFFHYSSS